MLRKKYVLLPPPNMTGAFHLGHAIEHHLVYFYSIAKQGSYVIGGFDHAGISAEMQIDPNHTLSSREIISALNLKFINTSKRFLEQWKVWNLPSPDCMKFSLSSEFKVKAKEVYHLLLSRGFIKEKMIKLNLNVDNGKSVSDAEVKVKTVTKKLYYLRYRLSRASEDLNYIEIATTLPGTIFNDQAICVHPDDDRYTHLIGSYCYVPLIDRKIPILSSEDVILKFGSGAVKVTPLYDEKDYQRSLSLDLPLGEPIFDDQGKCTQVGYKDLTFSETEEKVLNGLHSLNLISRVETYQANSNFFMTKTDTGSTIRHQLIDYMSLELVVDLKQLVDKHAIKLDQCLDSIYPIWCRNEVKSWLSRADYWCISRKASWGVSIEDKREGQVFDTWWTAALWPILTNLNADLDCLISGWDLIFFWFLKMTLISLEVEGHLPFKKVFFHGLIVDNLGRKMSKSLENVINPDECISSLGLDVFRLRVLRLVTSSKYIKFSLEQDQEHKLINKLYNLRNLSLTLNDEEESWLSELFTLKYFNTLRNFLSFLRNFNFHEAYTELYEHIFWVSNTLSVVRDQENLGVGSALRSWLLTLSKDLYFVLPEFSKEVRKTVQGSLLKDTNVSKDVEAQLNLIKIKQWMFKNVSSIKVNYVQGELPWELS